MTMPQSKSASASEVKARRSDLLRNFLLTFPQDPSDNFYVGFLIFVAVLLHKLPEGLTIASFTFAVKKTRTLALLSSVGLGLATSVGALLTVLLGSADPKITAYAPLKMPNFLPQGTPALFNLVKVNVKVTVTCVNITMH